MIVRVFRAQIQKGKIQAFKRMLQEQSIPWLASAKGMLGYTAGEPLGEDDREFVVVTRWRDLEALKAFAGDKWQMPLITADEEPLVEKMEVLHFRQFETT